jgi:DNA segregation ATPase FtsK/SpoIIIE-like protein
MVIATRDLSVNALPSHLLASVPARMSFRQARKFDSALVLGTRGAEELTEAGELLFSRPATRVALSLKGPYLGGEGLQRVVTAWRDHMAGHTTPGEAA